MKILAVKPGSVLPWVTGGFGYSIRYDTPAGIKIATSEGKWDSANAAKQAMREKVAHERKRHGLA